MVDNTFAFIPPGSRLLTFESIKIANIVATATLDFKFDLDMLNVFTKASPERRARFPASNIYVKYRTINMMGLVFATASITSPGSLTVKEAELRLNLLRVYTERCITNNYTNSSWIWNPKDKSICDLLNPKIRNVVITAKFSHGIDIGRFARQYPLNVRYEVDSFPAAIYAPMYVEKDTKIRAIIFLVGKIVIVGAQTFRAADNVVKELRYVLVGFEKNSVDIHANNRFVSEYEAFLGRRSTDPVKGRKTVFDIDDEEIDGSEDNVQLQSIKQYGLFLDELDELAY